MRKIQLFLICAFALLCSCTPSKERNLQRLENLTAEVKANSDNYTAEDWNKFLVEYQTTDSLLSQEQYTEEEREHIGQLKGECAGYLVKAGAVALQEQLNGALQEASGAAKGFMDALTGKKDDK